LFAIIQQGGKQYKIEVGTTVGVEKIKGNPGEKIELKNILMVHTDEGKVLSGEEVAKTFAKATIIEQYKGKKVIIFKKKRRETYRKRFGHRQKYTKVKIDEIHLKEGEQ
jgi:large subunit ribosomal protein L21